MRMLEIHCRSDRRERRNGIPCGLLISDWSSDLLPARENIGFAGDPRFDPLRLTSKPEKVAVALGHGDTPSKAKPE